MKKKEKKIVITLVMENGDIIIEDYYYKPLHPSRKNMRPLGRFLLELIKQIEFRDDVGEIIELTFTPSLSFTKILKQALDISYMGFRATLEIDPVARLEADLRKKALKKVF